MTPRFLPVADQGLMVEFSSDLSDAAHAEVLALDKALAANPFPGRPPLYIRAILYRYRFAPPGNPEGLWWHRERIGDAWIPAMSVNDPRLTGFGRRYVALVSWRGCPLHGTTRN